MESFQMPPCLQNDQGKERRVGFEIEFGGLTVAKTAQLVQAVFGGHHHPINNYHHLIETPEGQFDVSLDFAWLRDQSYQQLFQSIGWQLPATGNELVETILDSVFAGLVPLEITTPPLNLSRLYRLVPLEKALREHRARDTHASLVYAFALHINPEAPAPLDPGCWLVYLRAFLVLYHWLFRICNIDVTRRVLPFFDPFPESYVRKVLEPSYQPDATQFINDYLADNPTRNRPLDLLPLLATADYPRLEAAGMLATPVKPRPTYHYRLPNSQLEDPDWSIATEWNRWVMIEKLTARPELLAEMAKAYLEWEGSLLGYLREDWIHLIEQSWIRAFPPEMNHPTC